MRGRKPALKGSAVKGASGGFPKCPAWLGKPAKAVWQRIAGEMGEQLICGLDVDLFATYCSDVALFQKAEKKIARSGEVVKSPNGHEVQSPWLAIRNRAQQRIAKSAAELGLSPVARTRVSAVSPSPVRRTERPAATGAVQMRIAE